MNSSQLNITCAPPPPPHGRWERCEAPPVSFFLQFGDWQDIGTLSRLVTTSLLTRFHRHNTLSLKSNEEK